MSGQVALITGSSRGIGLAAAIALARAGFDVALNTLSEGDELDAAARKVAAEGVRVCKAAFDVSEIGEHAAALARIEDSLGPITTLVNLCELAGP